MEIENAKITNFSKAYYRFISDSIKISVNLMSMYGLNTRKVMTKMETGIKKWAELGREQGPLIS
jgi:hypothetical protein